MSTAPRRPLVPPVPGPSTPRQSISERAIAVREQGPPGTAGGLTTNGGKVADRFYREPSKGLAAPPAFVPAPLGNIAGAIASVMANIGTIQKGGYNSFHRYHYARMEDLLAPLTPLIGQNGLAIFQSEIGRSIVEGNRLCVDYEFTVAHKSGEVSPAIKQAGMAAARDSKGNWDEKAVAKAHTNARKYFLLSLFQVPAGDFDDPDADRSDANQRKAPVPGPGTSGDEPQQKPARETNTSATPVDERLPHKLVLGPGAGADQWGNAFIKAIGTAKTVDEVREWDKQNDETLQRLSDKYADVYAIIETAMQSRLDALEPKPEGGDVWKDPQEAMNWVAEQLAGMKSFEAAQEFWNQTVEPQRENFDEVDWEMLMEEWKRTELRLAPKEDEAT